MSTRRKDGNQEGFTLVEIVVAITIIAIGILGLSAVFPRATADVGESGVNTKALELCQEKIEDLHTLAYDSSELRSGFTHADTLNPIGGTFTRTWESFENDPVSGCKRITVVVSWQSHTVGSTHLTSIIASAGR